MNEQVRLRATGRQQDLAALYARLSNARRQVTGGNYEITLERGRVTARFDFFRVFYFGWFQQFSQELPALRLAVTWRLDGHNVGYQVYGAGVVELEGVEIIRGKRHANHLWKRANGIADGHMVQLA